MAAEAEIETYLVKQVKACKGKIRKVKWIGVRGCPDRLVWIPTWKTAIFVELKAPGKKLEAHQVREHKRLRAMGLTTCVIDSKKHIDWLLEQK